MEALFQQKSTKNMDLQAEIQTQYLLNTKQKCSPFNRNSHESTDSTHNTYS